MQAPAANQSQAIQDLSSRIIISANISTPGPWLQPPQPRLPSLPLLPGTVVPSNLTAGGNLTAASNLTASSNVTSGSNVTAALLAGEPPKILRLQTANTSMVAHIKQLHFMLYTGNQPVPYAALYCMKKHMKPLRSNPTARLQGQDLQHKLPTSLCVVHLSTALCNKFSFAQLILFHARLGLEPAAAAASPEAAAAASPEAAADAVSAVLASAPAPEVADFLAILAAAAPAPSAAAFLGPAAEVSTPAPAPAPGPAAQVPIQTSAQCNPRTPSSAGNL